MAKRSKDARHNTKRSTASRNEKDAADIDERWPQAEALMARLERARRSQRPPSSGKIPRSFREFMKNDAALQRGEQVSGNHCSNQVGDDAEESVSGTKMDERHERYQLPMVAPPPTGTLVRALPGAG